MTYAVNMASVTFIGMDNTDFIYCTEEYKKHKILMGQYIIIILCCTSGQIESVYIIM